MTRLWLLTYLWCALVAACSSISVKVRDSTILGPDPQTVNRLNGESFQQDALVTFNGYQYAVFWTADVSNSSLRYVNVARRRIDIGAGKDGNWSIFELTDYVNTNDDGHDIISLGISHGDGTLHISFDQHDNNLNYRISQPGVATNPESVEWSPSVFGLVLPYLPGLESLNQSIYYINITYPRFLSIPSSYGFSADLLLEMRTGQSGLGDDWIYTYTPHKGWSIVGLYLEGVNNNAYINGLDFDNHGTLHVTWTYRDYVNTTGQDVAVEAGPNGPGNNHGLYYSFSSNLAKTWYNNWAQPISNPAANTPIYPTSPGVSTFDVPKYSGILNQEAQVVDNQGCVHVLNRENTTGTELWYHYWRDVDTWWTRTAFPLNLPGPNANNITGTPTYIGKRGKLVSVPHSKSQTLLAILPSNAANSSALSILSSTAAADFTDWRVIWEAPNGCVAEPLYDRYRLEVDGILSLYLVNGTEVEVLDFYIES